MDDILLLDFCAPLMSFGGATVDEFGVIRPFPAASMITGLLGNALGYSRSDASALARLQERVHYAVREDRAPEHLTDYQTADVGQPFMLGPAWSTDGVVRTRGDSWKLAGTVQRYRDYWADGRFTVALTLKPADEQPSIDDLAQALRRPARTLFLGRKSCPPATRIFAGRTEAEDVLAALRAHPSPEPGREAYKAWWPADLGSEEAAVRIPVTDQRDWVNQIHTGRRLVAHGLIRSLTP
jgi:CRISPR system Cascade subunit CasD